MRCEGAAAGLALWAALACAGCGGPSTKAAHEPQCSGIRSVAAITGDGMTCKECLETNCCGEAERCIGNRSCRAIGACQEACPEDEYPQCWLNCHNRFPDGKTDFIAMRRCREQCTYRDDGYSLICRIGVPPP